jgi:anti-sigma factor RsiW
MDCHAIKQLLEAHLNGGLELTRQLEVEAHLTRCPSCNKLAETVDKDRYSVRMNIPTYKAPSDLRASIRVALQRETQPEMVWLGWFRRPFLSAAAVLVVSIGSVLAWMAVTQGKNRELIVEAISNHARSLLVGHAVDVTSADRQKIKPWFAEKLNYSPPIANLADAGYELIGGRIDMLDRHPVAAIVYQRSNRIINVFVWPTSRGTIDFQDQVHRGYLICGWNKSGLNYIVVADLSNAEMENFEDSLRDRTE